LAFPGGRGTDRREHAQHGQKQGHATSGFDNIFWVYFRWGVVFIHFLRVLRHGNGDLDKKSHLGRIASNRDKVFQDRVFL
jgi:hypothetical protein